MHSLLYPAPYYLALRYKHVTLNKGGLQWSGVAMEYVYKDHRIELSVGLDGDAWIVSIFIYYSENLRNILVTFPVDQEFKTYAEAVEAGLAAAKKYIDGRMSNSGH
jgi:hypothetical protein